MGKIEEIYGECVHSSKLQLLFPYSLTHRESRALEMIHGNLCGPIELEILGGSKYLLLLIDD